jgi:hypothetical protein
VLYDSGSFDDVYGIATDSTGDVAVAGTSLQNVSPSRTYFYTAKYAAGDGQLRWEFKKPPETGDDQSSACAMDSEGNVVVTGRVGGTVAGDMYTAKYASSDGHLLWEKTYSGAGSNYDVGNAIAVDGAGNVVVTGRSAGGAPLGPGMYTAKYASADGRLMWEHYLRPSNELATAYNVKVDAAGDVIVLGATIDGLKGDRIHCVKYSGSDGSILWQRQPQPQTHSSVQALALDASNNVYITGLLGTPPVQGVSGSQLYVAKFASSNGEVLWQSFYDKPGIDWGHDIAVDLHGDVIVTGRSALVAATGTEDIYTAKYSGRNGSLLWDRRVDRQPGQHEFGSTIVLDSIGNVYAICSSTRGSDREIYIAKYGTASGILLSEQTYNRPGFTDDYVREGDAVATPEGGFVMAVSAGSTPYDFATVKRVPTASTAAPQLSSVGVTNITTTSGRFQAVALSSQADAVVDVYFDGTLQGRFDVKAGSGEVPVSLDVSNLSPHTEHTFRAVALSVGHAPQQQESRFQTLNTAPTAQSLTIHAPPVGVTSPVYSAASHTSDGDGDTRSLEVSGYSGSGSVTTDGAVITYSNAGFVGVEVITIRVTDGFGGVVGATVTLENTAPAAQAKVLHAPKIGVPTVLFTASSESSDADNDPRTVSVLTYTGNGQAASDGSEVTFINGGFAGEEVVTVRVSDGRGGFADAAISLRNAGPTTTDKSFHAPVVGSSIVVFNVNADTSDPDNDSRVVALVSHNGTGSVNTDGADVTYTNNGLTGMETIVLRITDDRGGAANATVTLKNTAPVAEAKVLHAPKIGVPTVLFTASSESSDADNDPRTVSILSYTGNGQVTSDGSEVTFINGGFAGEGVVTVRVSDGRGGFADAAISLRNAGPTTTDKSFHAPVTGSSIVVFKVNPDSSDPDNDSRVVALVSYTGTGSVNTDGADVTYTNNGLTGMETIVLRVTDDRGGAANATVTLENTAPVAEAKVLHAPNIGTANVIFTASSDSSDADIDPRTVSVLSYTGNGQVTSNGSEVTFINGGFVGEEIVMVRVSDGRGGFADAAISLRNAGPSTTDKSIHAPAVGSSIVVFNVNADSSDTDNDSRVVALVSYNGTGSVNTDGADVTYTNNGLTGMETIVLRVMDERGGVANATVQVSNQAPVATNSLITWPGRAPLEIAVLPLVSDSEGDGLAISGFSVPAYGTLVSGDAGMVTYVPGDAFEGRDAFTYTLQDDRGARAVATIQVQSTSVSYVAIAAEGEPVPGAGEVGSGIPAGAVWDAFGPPSLIGSEVGWLGTFRTPEAKFDAVFSGEPAAPKLWIKTGDTAVDDAGVALTGTTFRQLDQPVFSAADRFAVKGKLQGKGVAAINDEAIWVMNAGSLRRVAAEGAVAPGTDGATFRRFTSVAFTEGGVLYLVARLGAGSQISASNDTGLWRWTESEGLTLLLREGMSIQSGSEEARLRSFTTLNLVAGSSGEGRYDSLSSLLPVRLSLSGKMESITMIQPDGALEIGSFSSSVFGPPDVSGEAGDGAVLEALPLGVDGVTSRNRWQITNIKTNQSLARSMEAAPGIEGATFTKFLDPVSGLIHSKTVTGFIAKVRAADPAGEPIQRFGIWTRTHNDAEELQSLAVQDGVAPETQGETFAGFVSLAVLPDYGPLFKAKLLRSETVSRQNDEGLWAVDSSGTLRLILRDGETLFAGGQERRLVSFSTLDTVLGSPAQRRSFGSDPGRLVCRAKFDDGKTAIVRVTVP